MNLFRKTSHLSEIIEESEKQPVIIFKYSNDCGSSDILMKELEKAAQEEIIKNPVYVVTVQVMPVLSAKISNIFAIKHESPQIIVLNRGKVTYTDHHNFIKIKDFRY